MPLVSGELKDKRIDDLLRKRPQGPIGRRVTYTVDSSYDYEKGKYVSTPIPSHSLWGYSDEEIFSLGLYSREDVETYVLKRWFNGLSKWGLGSQRATFTRRVNRLWDQRIERVVERVRREGGDGIYKVQLGRKYYSRPHELGHIYAADRVEARRFAEMFFSYLCEDELKIQISFVRFGKPAEIIALNAQTINKAANTIDECKKKIEQLNQMIEKQGVYLETLNMVQEQQLSIEN